MYVCSSKPLYMWTGSCVHSFCKYSAVYTQLQTARAIEKSYVKNGFTSNTIMDPSGTDVHNIYCNFCHSQETNVELCTRLCVSRVYVRQLSWRVRVPEVYVPNPRHRRSLLSHVHSTKILAAPFTFCIAASSCSSRRCLRRRQTRRQVNSGVRSTR